ncbi:MAG: Hsp70 family protein [Candidatus Scalindua sp.]|nr:Hsp70 family protein [Candidatus Scalindua sp.]MBT6226485.1 Hsp70 family protein [Candidatus Scalindua sp.]MBT6563547.1 Hsp70 family protein [Candidatus Scalindua sp.]MBT7210101.1 Hsp70 family protein [Candidatus Scalindua sp.]MBT7589730.1 Hsp70 family protein [Candidatus Scalindua sp.]
MKDTKYIIGIDLGTTHCVLSYTEAQIKEDSDVPNINIFEIPQVIAQGEIKSQPLLPSFLFLPGEHDVPEGSLAVPWDREIDCTVGEFARQRGAEIPNRLVSSSKSWLCHSSIDRTKPILPWESPPETRRVSPVEASGHLLKHLREAWNYEMASEDPDARLEDQEIYLTVPASFDAVARELTVKAAESAGLSNMTLLEEPQAAFYAWIESQKNWRKIVKAGESILVCDIGGGTTDLSLIQVAEEDGNLILRRVAVGNHILLGGDNMDLTLAYAIHSKLAQKGTKLDAWQFRGLVHSCRAAKEQLLNNPDRKEEPISILGRGSSLIKSTIRTELTRAEIESVLLDGFLPMCGSTDYPQEKSKVGIREMGLPYESDPAISRHLASFIGQQAGSGDKDSEVPYPSSVLFNGGVMKSDLMKQRILAVLNKWSETENEMKELPSSDLDLSVARGAAYYGHARRGRGFRIRGGTAHSYYIGIERSMPSVPGIPTPMKALCIVPFGQEEGTGLDIRQREFGLVVGEPAVFHLFASNLRKKEEAGEVIEDWSGEIEEITTMETELTSTGGEEGGNVIPVWLQIKLTEIGTLELWCVSSEDEDRRWKLEFNLRKSDEKEE